MINWLRRILPSRTRSRLRRDQSGSATIEFVLWVPFFMLIMLASLESGLLIMQRSMLERALDLTVRDLRIGAVLKPTHAELSSLICDRVMMVPSCKADMILEMLVVKTNEWKMPKAGATCVNKALVPPDEVTMPSFEAGKQNDVIIIRACLKVNPFFAINGIGIQLRRDNAGMYAMVASSAFANEPRKD